MKITKPMIQGLIVRKPAIVSSESLRFGWAGNGLAEDGATTPVTPHQRVPEAGGTALSHESRWGAGMVREPGNHPLE